MFRCQNPNRMNFHLLSVIGRYWPSLALYRNCQNGCVSAWIQLAQVLPNYDNAYKGHTVDVMVVCTPLCGEFDLNHLHWAIRRKSDAGLVLIHMFLLA